MTEPLYVPIDELSTFEGRCKYLYKIKDKEMQTVSFGFTESQKILNNIVEDEFIRTKQENGVGQGRFIILKPRQIGATTYFGVRAFDKLLNEQGCNVLTMAHNTETTELIYEIYKRCYNNLPDIVVPTRDGNPMTMLEYLEDQHPDSIENMSSEERNQYSSIEASIKVKSTTKNYSGKKMAFEDNDSRSTIQTAGSGDDAVKGITPSVCHFSESASYPDYHSTITSAMPAVPKRTDGVMIVFESTANGVSGKGEGFYKAWTQNSKAWDAYRSGRSNKFAGFRPIFIPWYMIEEYEEPLAGGQLESLEGIDFGGPDEKQAFLDKEAMMREGVHNPLTGEKTIVSEEKINWYRWIIKTDCEYDYNQAKRYYPTTPEEAFTASSHCFFDAQKLSDLKTMYINNPPKFEQGELDWDDESEVTFTASSLGGWKFFEFPDPMWENRYILSADSGRGYEDGDYSDIKVKDRLTQKIIGYYHDKIDQDLFADELIKGGYFYNEALLVPESNLETVVIIIRPDGIKPYLGMLYYDEQASSIRWGYHTHGGSRKPLLDQYKAHLRDNELGYKVLPDVTTVEQHLTFVRKPATRVGGTVKYEADEGEHDDLVIAGALTEAGERFLQNLGEVVKKKEEDSRIMNLISKPFKRRRGRRQSSLGRSA